MRARSAFAVLLAAALCAVTLVARAQDATAEARTAFQQGADLLDARRYADAAAAFERSLALHESASARYDLALAYRGLGRTRDAIAALRRLLANPSEGAQRMLDDAATILAEEERALVHVTLHLRGTPQTLSVDGEALAPTDGQRVELDAGHHVFRAQAAGREAVAQELDVAAGASTDVTVDLEGGAEILAHLEVHARPPEARILLDGAERGRGDATLALSPSTYALRIVASGYRTAERDVDLSAGAMRRIDVALERATPPTSLWESPWFWTATGAVVGAVVTTVLVVALSGPVYVVRDPADFTVVALH